MRILMECRRPAKTGRKIYRFAEGCLISAFCFQNFSICSSLISVRAICVQKYSTKIGGRRKPICGKMNQLYYGDNLHVLREHIADEFGPYLFNAKFLWTSDFLFVLIGSR